LRVLVVDDDEATRLLLERGLAQHGWETRSASDGEAALAMARDDRFDACISDILMPRMDGYALCREWRRDPDLRDIPFVFFTATYVSEDDQAFALALGADGFVVKPKRPDDLVELIEPILRVQSSLEHQDRPRGESMDEETTLERYSARLVRKLEDKVLQLEQSNRDLKDALDMLSDEVEVKSGLIAEVDGHLSAATSGFDVRSPGAIPEVMRKASIPIVVLDESGEPVQWNQAAEELTSQLLDEAASPAVLPQLDGPAGEGFSAAVDRMLSGQTVHAAEMIPGDIEEGRFLVVSGGPIRHDGEIAGAMAVIDDVTERRRAEARLADHRDRLEDLVEQRTAELLAANERLEEAARAKSAFVAGMGHEMRNKLNSIIGFSGILLQGLGGDLEDEQRKNVEMVYEAGQSLVALVNDVVDLSKIEAGQLEVRVAPFELLGLLDGIVDSFKRGAEEQGVDVDLEAPSGVIPMHSDRTKVEQVVRNLVSNAVKFAPGGAVAVEVERADEGTSTVIRVRDDGVGISPDAMDRIFDEFVTFDPRDRAASSGTGLGLALTRRLCEMLGGSVSARSNPGEGSVFTVVLPVDISVPRGEDGVEPPERGSS
jgi:PAS domain S-box-containing protein